MLSVLVLLARVVTAVAKAVLETLVTLVTLVVMVLLVLLVLLPTWAPLVAVANRATLVAGQHGSGGKVWKEADKRGRCGPVLARVER